MSHRPSRSQFPVALLLLIVPFAVSGCMNPYYGYPPRGYGYGYPVQQQYPMNSNPGSLYIPEGDDTYDPENTYDEDPQDDFKAGNGQFYGEGEDGAPLPRDLNEQRFRDDLGGPSSFYIPDAHPQSDSGIQLVSGTQEQPGLERAVAHQTIVAKAEDGEYGFDTKDYRWLRGVLRYDAQADGWMITYSLAARDKYRGSLPLALSAAARTNLAEGSNVDIVGERDESLTDQQGRPLYRVASITPVAQ